MTQVFNVPYPWHKYQPWPKGVKDWKSLTPAQQRVRCSHWQEGYRETFITIWHVDPCKGPGGDDSCGWFMRAHHGDKAVLEKIVSRFEFDFDRTFTSDGSGHVYCCGLFRPDGDPHLSVQGIVLNLFFIAAIEHFKSDGRTNWKVAKRWLRKNHLDIMLFAENPTDSLFDGLTRKFEKGCNEPYTKRNRDERVRKLACSIYGWILRSDRPWYKHPRWHLNHLRLQIHPWQKLKRFLTKRCYLCKKRIGYNDVPCSDHHGLMCGKCSGPVECKTP